MQLLSRIYFSFCLKPSNRELLFFSSLSENDSDLNQSGVSLYGFTLDYASGTEKKKKKVVKLNTERGDSTVAGGDFARRPSVLWKTRDFLLSNEISSCRPAAPAQVRPRRNARIRSAESGRRRFARRAASRVQPMRGGAAGPPPPTTCRLPESTRRLPPTDDGDEAACLEGSQRAAERVQNKGEAVPDRWA